MPPNFVVVFPSTGTTSTDPKNPTEILIGLNETVVKGMLPGNYSLFVTFSTLDQSPPSQASVLVLFRLSVPQPPVITSVLNNASNQKTISPGMIVSIFGSNLGPDIGPIPYDDTGSYPTALVRGEARIYGEMSVTFGGIAAPLLYWSPGRVDAIVPSGLAGQGSADVVLSRYNLSTAPVNIQLQDISPGVYTLDESGSGQGAISNLLLGVGNILGTTPNSASNPARKGDAISLLATGFGPWNPPVPDGIVSLGSGPLTLPPGPPVCGYLPLCKMPAAPVSLTIGGKPATLLYTGPASYQPWSKLQIAAYVPVDVDSGPQPVVLTVGQSDNSQQNVTVAVQ
jgi:uncharacterized protein (TIGR03437 family)